MDLDEYCFPNTRKIAEYFVICGLPKAPTPFNASKVLTQTEEIIIPDVSVDFTRFQEPIVDIKIVSVRDNEEIPSGYTPIKRTYTGKFKAHIKGRIGDEVYICYRRGRDKPPITDIAMFTDISSNRLLQGAEKITKTCGGRNANFRSTLATPVYLSYRRAPANSGVDRLAVTDMCIIIPSKHETCPPAFNLVSESLNSNPLITQLYLCFRKSLIKQHIIAYDPKVLSWYRVREPFMEFESDAQGPSELTKTLDNEEDGTADSNDEQSVAKVDNASLDPDICQVANFCLPWGAAIESWSVEQEPPQPNYFTFVLTNETYQRLYGVAFTFYEPYDVCAMDMDKCYLLGVEPELIKPSSTTSIIQDEVDTVEEARIATIQKHFICSRIGDRVIGVTKTLCLLSRWSFPVAFTNFLAFLYSRWQPAAKDDPIPFERYLAHFLCEVPFPTQTMPNVMVELCAAPILLNFPEDNDAVSKCEPFFFLLDCLGVDLTIQLLVQMLTEQKILLTSVNHFFLTQVGEALTAMIFPLRWTVVYIPFIYIGCIHVIQSPSPYLIGVDSRFFDFFRLPPGGGVTYVDLDTRNFKLPESSSPGQPVLDAKMLPKKPLKLLRATLTKLFTRIKALRPSRAKQTTNVLFQCMFTQAGSQLANSELNVLERRLQWLKEFSEMTTIGLHIKNAFMHFMAQLLKDYRRFLIPVRQAQRDILFNAQGFLKEVAEKHSRPFYQALFDTQQWANFVRDRSYVSARDEELSQFDSYMFRMFGNPLEHSPMGSQTLSDSSNSSVRGFGDVGGEAYSQTGSTNSIEVTEEPRILKMLSSGSISNDAVHVVGPPKWPIAELEANAFREAEAISDRNSQLVSVKLNTKLLDLIVAHIYREKAAASTGEVSGLDAPDAVGRYPHSSSSRSGSSHNLAIAARHMATTSKSDLGCPVNDPLLFSLMTSDVPSPFNFRSATAMALSLTGLPTRHPLPVGGSVILRRSPLELHQTAEFVKRASAEGGLVWAHHIVYSIYSLWFMLLPSYLSSIYSSAGEQSTDQSSPDAGLHMLNEVLTEAVQLVRRLLNYGVTRSDQVFLRIILVLVYQHRPPHVDLATWLDPELWNSSSMVLVNLIFKTFEKELKDKQRLEHEQSQRQVPQTHRRSASLTYDSADQMSAIHNEPHVGSDVPQTAATSTLTATSAQKEAQHQSPNQVLTHRRSSSSTATSLASSSLATNSAVQPKSETDSGLLIGTVGDDSVPDDPVGCARDTNDAVEVLVDSMDRMTVTGKTAPLASMTELDLGYATLNRPESANGDSSLASTLRITEPTPGCSGLNDPSLTPVTKATQACQDEPVLEAVQKPPLDMVQQPAEPVIFQARGANGIIKQATRTTSEKPSDSEDEDSEASESNSDSSRMSRPRFNLDADPRSVVADQTAAAAPRQRIYPATLNSADGEHGSRDRSPTGSSAALGPGEFAQQNQKPRGSLDYLNNALSLFGKSTSDLLSKLNIPVRDWLGTGTPSTPIADYVPWNGRRATTTGLSTPGSARIPRRVPFQRAFNEAENDDDDEEEEEENTNSGGYFNEAVVAGPHESMSSPEFLSHHQGMMESELDPNGAYLSPPISDLDNYTNYWYAIAGQLANGKAHQRSFPATQATLRRLSVLPSHHASRLPTSPLLPRVPTRSSSVEPGFPQHPIAETSQPSTAVHVNRSTHASSETFALESEPRGSPADHLDTVGSERRSMSTTPIASDGSPCPCPSVRVSQHSPMEAQPTFNNVCRLNVIMTTCNTCPSCKRFVHDEEIMAAWSPDETEYNIPCPFCGNSFVPKIVVRILGDVYNPHNTAPSGFEVPSAATSPATGSVPTRRRGSACSGSHRRSTPFTSRGLMEFTQHYLSPFVLRKALETVIQHEGDESLRVQTPGHSFLYKHEQLTWSLVWYTQRIGLLTNLLDTLPTWLMDQQLKAQKRVASMGGTNLGARRTDNGSLIPDALLHVRLSPNLPVMISLRWNSYQMARGKANTPLYKQFLTIRDECKSPWALIPGGSEINPALSPGTLGLSTCSDCPVEATIARMLNAIRKYQVRQALDTLLALRACILGGKPISKVINHGSFSHSGLTSSSASGRSVDGSANHPAPSDLTHSRTKGSSSSSSCRTRCTDSHRGAWCLEGSLYRELLYFTITVLQSNHVNVLAFDEQFNAAYFNYLVHHHPYLNDADRAPCLVAVACRQMLRPLTLVP